VPDVSQRKRKAVPGSSHNGEFDREERKQKAVALELDANKLMADVKEGIAKVRSGAEWQKYLDSFSDFHQYSLHNAALIRAQLEEATQVASYKLWESKGVHVKKGEKALRVLAPRMYKSDDLDKDGKNILKIAGFRPVPVFDRSQTDADEIGFPDPASSHPYNKAMQAQGEAPPGMIEAITDKLVSMGYDVSIGDTGQSGVNGVTYPQKKKVVVNQDLSPLRRAATLAHEYGHVMLHTEDSGGLHTVSHERSAMEIEAESMSYVLSTAWGIDPDVVGAKSLNYFASWAQGSSEEKLDKILSDAAGKLTKHRTEMPFPANPFDLAPDVNQAE
jgi:antirestriction protein ArdC